MALIDITPKMTSNTTPAPYKVSASSEYVDINSKVYGAWNAFNGSSSGAVGESWSTAEGNALGWIQIDFNTPTSVSGFTMISGYALAMIKDFNLQASNNGTSFQTVKSFTNETDWSSSELRFFILDSHVTYRYYRINIIANNGYEPQSRIGEIRFFQGDITLKPETNNSKFSLNYCLPKNSTLAIEQRVGDDREGLLGFANDPDDRYGTLYLIDNRGNAIIPKAGMAEADVLWEGSQTSTGTLNLTKAIDDYSYVIVYGRCYISSADNNQISGLVIHKDIYYEDTYKDWTFMLNMSIDNNTRRAVFSFPSNLTLSVQTITSAQIFKVIGVK